MNTVELDTLGYGLALRRKVETVIGENVTKVRSVGTDSVAVAGIRRFKWNSNALVLCSPTGSYQTGLTTVIATLALFSSVPRRALEGYVVTHALE